MGIVEQIVKCHSSPRKTGLFIAETVLQITSLHQDLEAVDLEEDPEAMVVTEALDLADETIDHAK